VRHGREPLAHRGPRGLVDRARLVPRVPVQPEAADEEALGGGRALPRDRRRRLFPAHEAALPRPRGGLRLPGAARDGADKLRGMKARIVISEFMDRPAVDRLAARHDVDYRPLLVDDAAMLAAALPGAQAWIVRNRTPVRGALLSAAGEVRVIGRLGVGLDNIDVAACTARGIEVIPATGANAES